MEAVYDFSSDFSISEKMKEDFDENGYILIRGLLDSEEMIKLRDALENDEGILTKSHDISMLDGKGTKMCSWNHPGNDITGIISRSEKMVNTMESLLGGEVYHYHTKLMMKDARKGGPHLWHQDYGYWYLNGCLYPDMGTVFIAVDKCTRNNGCLQILPQSHKFGRIDHYDRSGQRGADLERMEHILAKIRPVCVEINPGDAIFFHCNLLHKSDPNTSDDRRWAFLTAYNRASNNPVIKHYRPRYVQLQKVSNNAIKECTTVTDLKNKGFVIPAKNLDDRMEMTIEDYHLN